VVGVVNSIPLVSSPRVSRAPAAESRAAQLPKVMELVGLGYSSWFV